MKAFFTHFIFDFKTGLRDRSLLLMNYLFPLGFYLMMGLIMTKISTDFSTNLVPAMTCFTILASTALGMPNILVSGRELGIFRSYKINGVPIASILGIPSLSVLIHTFIVTLVILITGPTFFGGSSPENLLGFLAGFLVMAIAAIGLALLIGVISKDTQVTIIWSQLIFTPSMIIGGLMIPTETLPDSIQFVGRLLPTTYAMNIFKSLAYNQQAIFSVAGSFLVLLSGGIVSIALAFYLFKWDYHDEAKFKKPALALLALLPYIIGAVIL